MTDRDHKIRERAYGIWEAEGYPHGRADDHWHRAAQEVEDEPKSIVPTQAELIPDIGEAPSLQTEDAAPTKKAAPRRRTATKKPAAESAPDIAPPKTKSRATPAAGKRTPRKS